MNEENTSTKSKILILIIDKLIIVVIVALVGWYIDSKIKILDSELTIQRDAFLEKIKTENEKNLKQMDQNFQMQQIQKQHDFDLQLERFKTNSNFSTDLAKTKIENQKNAFNRLMAIKIPLTQSIRTNLEAKALSEFYERRYQLFSNDIKDLDEAKRQNERGINLIKDISNYQKELFEVLGLIQTNFIIDNDLKKAINDLYNYEVLDISPFPMNFKTQTELDIFFKKICGEIGPAIKKEYSNKIEKIIIILKGKIK